jgi:hypothetical protein
MKFIFNNYWFSNFRYSSSISALSYQPMPAGGWKNWTVEYNLTWLKDEVENGETFCLIGEVDDLLAQAKNAGIKRGTKCTIGVEILYLINMGYTPRRLTRSDEFYALYGNIIPQVLAVLEPPAAISDNIAEIHKKFISYAPYASISGSEDLFWTRENREFLVDFLYECAKLSFLL